MAEAFGMSWAGAPVLEPTGRDQRIAAGEEVAAVEEAYEYDEDAGGYEYYNPQTKETAPLVKKRRIRVEGGAAPLAKPITIDYDSDDGRIIELKQQGYSDSSIAEMLRQEGRTRYVDKTIGSRFLRIRKLLQEKEDERLDDELSDWHAGEDDKLLPLAADIEKKYEAAVAKLEERKWRDLSCAFEEKIGKRKYTANAVRERVQALRDGTELCPIEHDDDQVGRRKMREERIAAAKKKRAEEAAAVKEAEEYKKAKTAAKKLATAEANQKKVQIQLKRIADKNERLRIREERKVNRELARHNRLALLAKARAQRDWDMERNRQEKQLYKSIMGVEIDGKPSKSGRNTKSGYQSDESDQIDEFESDEEEAQMTDEEQGDADDEGEEGITEMDHSFAMADTTLGVDKSPANRGAPAFSTSTASTPISSRPAKSKTFPKGGGFNGTPVAKKNAVDPSLTSTTRARSSANLKAPQSKTSSSSPAVTENTILNPRSIMSRTELEALCTARNLPILPEDSESHPQLVARLNAADQALEAVQVDALIKKARLGSGGTKSAKIQRMQMAQAAQSEKGGLGLTTTDVDFMRGYEGFQGEFKYLLDDTERALRHT